MSQIRITPDALRTRAGEYKTEQDNMATMISTLDTLLSNLQGEWEGTASDAYAERYGELKPGFEAARDLLGEIAAALENVAGAMEETDANIASQFRV